MISEGEWIQALKARFKNSEHFSHDAFYDPASRLIITTDTLVEGVHFNLDWTSAFDLGWKTVAVNYSDLAATCGTPVWLTLNLSLPESVDKDFLSDFYDGIQACCAQFGGEVIGGDTTRGNSLVITATAIGRLAENSAVGRRDAAKPGDWVVLSEPVHGLSAVGLWALQNKLSGFEESKQAHNRPIPQLELGQVLGKSQTKPSNNLKNRAHSEAIVRRCLMDSSDGLADAAIQIAATSDVDIIIDASLIPSHPELDAYEIESGLSALDCQLYGGEDYGLFCCIEPKTLPENTRFTIIGEVQAKSEVSGQAYLNINGQKELLNASKRFQHFSGAAI